MKNVLVTGGAGFIGSAFLRHLQEKKSVEKIIVLDSLTYAGLRENLPKDDRIVFVHGYIESSDIVNLIFYEHKPDTVVNFAAESHVDRSIKSPIDSVMSNIFGVHNLLVHASEYWPLSEGKLRRVRFHQVSTDEVYGPAPEVPVERFSKFDEEARYNPSSPYSASKAAADHLVRAYHRTYGLPVTISCCSNNYGPRQHPEKLIAMTINACFIGGQISIHGDGLQTREWIHVDDNCRAIMKILEEGEDGETYNIGGSDEIGNLEVVKKICDMIDLVYPDSSPHSNLITHVAERKGQDRRYKTSSFKMRSLGWKPEVSFDEGLKETVRWYCENIGWLQKSK
jgi:dTDP-glucose 4,6-dehydratase